MTMEDLVQQILKNPTQISKSDIADFEVDKLCYAAITRFKNFAIHHSNGNQSVDLQLLAEFQMFENIWTFVLLFLPERFYLEVCVFSGKIYNFDIKYNSLPQYKTVSSSFKTMKVLIRRKNFGHLAESESEPINFHIKVAIVNFGSHRKARKYLHSIGMMS